MTPHTRIKAALLVVLLPFLLNGWYNPWLAKQSALLFWLGDLAAWLGLPALALAWLLGSNTLTWRALGLHHPAPHAWQWPGFLATCAAVSLLLYATYLGGEVLGKVLFPTNWLEVKFAYVSMMAKSGPWFWLALIYLALSAGIVEELFYRGVMHTLFSPCRQGQNAYVMVSSLIFAVTHWEGGVANLSGAWLAGLLLAYLYAAGRSLYPLIVAHVITDLLEFGEFFPG